MPVPVLLVVADSLTRSFGALPGGVTVGYAATLRGEVSNYQSAHSTAGAG